MLFLGILQIVISVLLVGAVLLQTQSGGLGTLFGGGEGSFYRSKRGMEKILFYATIVLAVLFVLTSLLGVILE